MASSEIARIKERRISQKRLNEVYADSVNAYLIHYSCESFYSLPGQPPVGHSTRVTSIAIRNLKSAQTKTWSIQKSAELLNQLTSLTSLATSRQTTYNLAQISAILDPLERDMLDGYFQFLASHAESTFIHWNMRDDNYGFSALEHRYRVLGGAPTILQDNRKLDLARELVTLYGRQYAPHTSPKGRKGRLMSIIELNGIADKDALQGAEEADAFVNGDFIKLHQSTLRKVDVLANIFDRAHQKSLVTKAGFIDKYGVHPVALVELVKNSPIVAALTIFATIGVTIINYERIFAYVKALF